MTKKSSPPPVINPQFLCGLDDSHVIKVKGGQRIHKECVAAFAAMQRAAATAGHNLQIASGFRDYQRQAQIWQRKVEHSQTSDVTPSEDALHQILRWSAMPGASRHHWGSDMDVYDPDVLGDAALQLEPWEYTANGPFAELYQWLQEHAAEYGFYWPYAKDRGGVSCEPWHLSFAPLSQVYQAALTPELLLEVWQQHPPARLDWLSEHVTTLYKRYVDNVCPPRAIKY